MDGIGLSRKIGAVIMVATFGAGILVSTAPPAAPAVAGGCTGVAYVTNYGDGTVSLINIATGMVSGTVPVDTHPYGVAITPDGSQAYVTGGDFSGKVSVITTATNASVSHHRGSGSLWRSDHT